MQFNKNMVNYKTLESGGTAQLKSKSCILNKKKSLQSEGSSGDSGATRTHDPQLRRLLLYPTELRNRLPAAKIHFFSVFATKKIFEYCPEQNTTLALPKSRATRTMNCGLFKLGPVALW